MYTHGVQTRLMVRVEAKSDSNYHRNLTMRSELAPGPVRTAELKGRNSAARPDRADLEHLSSIINAYRCLGLRWSAASYEDFSVGEL